MPDAEPKSGFHEIIQTRFLTESTFVLRFTREEMQFQAGQRLLVGLEGEMDQRDYSVYSGEQDDYLEILLKEVEPGHVSLKLKNCKPGQLLNVNGPFGSFIPEKSQIAAARFMFVATGTGISPFHSMVRSHPGLDYLILHGVRYKIEAYEKEEYEPQRYIVCTSGEKSGERTGRVTDYLKNYTPPSEMLFYLCGNSNMIFEATHILRNKGVPAGNIFSEIYF